MDDFHAIPEAAIACFERLHHLAVTVHDVRGDLNPFIMPERRRHRHAACMAVKASGHADACIAFDYFRMRQELPFHPEGRVQCCPAGLVEWVVPVLGEDGLRYILFAGAAALGPVEHLVTVRARATVQVIATPPAPLTADPTLVLEALRQLAARLRWWSNESKRVLASGPAPVGERRRVSIMQFIHEHHTDEIGLEDVGRLLGLSAVRAGAVVREACGEGFAALLVQARVGSATDLLRHTDLAVADIAVRSGFGDLSNFFRAFRRVHGTTPLQFRLASLRDGGRLEPSP